MTVEFEQIRVGKHVVGIISLRKILTDVQELSLEDETRVKEELLRRVKEANYVPELAEAEYREALYREYRRSLGDVVTDEDDFKIVRILGPGCPRCEELTERVYRVLAEHSINADVDHIRSPNEIAAFGLIATPGLVINGKVVSSGRVPSIDELRALLCTNTA